MKCRRMELSHLKGGRARRAEGVYMPNGRNPVLGHLMLSREETPFSLPPAPPKEGSTRPPFRWDSAVRHDSLLTWLNNKCFRMESNPAEAFYVCLYTGCGLYTDYGFCLL